MKVETDAGVLLDLEEPGAALLTQHARKSGVPVFAAAASLPDGSREYVLLANDEASQRTLPVYSSRTLDGAAVRIDALRLAAEAQRLEEEARRKEVAGMAARLRQAIKSKKTAR